MATMKAKAETDITEIAKTIAEGKPRIQITSSFDSKKNKFYSPNSPDT